MATACQWPGTSKDVEDNFQYDFEVGPASRRDGMQHLGYRGSGGTIPGCHTASRNVITRCTRQPASRGAAGRSSSPTPTRRHACCVVQETNLVSLPPRTVRTMARASVPQIGATHCVIPASLSEMVSIRPCPQPSSMTKGRRGHHRTATYPTRSNTNKRQSSGRRRRRNQVTMTNKAKYGATLSTRSRARTTMAHGHRGVEAL